MLQHVRDLARGPASAQVVQHDVRDVKSKLERHATGLEGKHTLHAWWHLHVWRHVVVRASRPDCVWCASGLGRIKIQG